MKNNDQSLYCQGTNDGIVELLVMLVDEIDSQGILDKGILLERIFARINVLENCVVAGPSTREAGIIDQLRLVARPLDKKTPRLTRIVM